MGRGDTLDSRDIETTPPVPTHPPLLPVRRPPRSDHCPNPHVPPTAPVSKPEEVPSVVHLGYDPLRRGIHPVLNCTRL